MKLFDKIKGLLDRPILWFAFTFWLGALIAEESDNSLSSVLIFIFAVLVWEYERRKRGK